MPELFETLLAKEVQSEPPVEMSSNPLMQLLRYFQGGGEDIELPNESGMVDPKLQAATPMDQLRKAFNITNKYAAAQGSPIDKLRAAGK